MRTDMVYLLMMARANVVEHPNARGRTTVDTRLTTITNRLP